jgi:hypothetical protein
VSAIDGRAMAKKVSPDGRMIAAVIFSFIACVFFLVGASASGTDVTTLETVNWLKGSDLKGGTELDYLVGLAAVYVREGPRGEQTGAVYIYKDCKGESAICAACESPGQIAQASTILALLFGIATVIISGIRIMHEGDVLTLACIVCNIVTCTFACAGMAVFDDCYTQLYDDYDNATYGSGIIIVLFGMLLMFFSLVLLNLLPLLFSSEKVDVIIDDDDEE